MTYKSIAPSAINPSSNSEFDGVLSCGTPIKIVYTKHGDPVVPSGTPVRLSFGTGVVQGYDTHSGEYRIAVTDLDDEWCVETEDSQILAGEYLKTLNGLLRRSLEVTRQDLTRINLNENGNLPKAFKEHLETLYTLDEDDTTTISLGFKGMPFPKDCPVMVQTFPKVDVEQRLKDAIAQRVSKRQRAMERARRLLDEDNAPDDVLEDIRDAFGE